MKRNARPMLARFGLRTTAFAVALAVVAAALVACQSILGFKDRGLLLVDAGDDGGGQDATSVEEDGGGYDATGDGADGSELDAADASDTSPTGVLDSGPVYTFTNPLQVDVSMLLNVNTIVTTADGGTPLTWMDGPGTSDENDFPTVSEMKTLNESQQYGLPDNAFFPASGQYTPNVQLAWTNANNLNPNSLVVSSVLNAQFTFTLPPAHYSQVQLYATGAAGASTLNYTLTYSDASTTSLSLPLPDWCLGSPTGGEFILAAVERVEFGTTFNDNQGGLVCHIFALNLSPDPGRELASVSFQDQVLNGGSTANLVFYGATAWQD
jgi:hypothetical protein